MQTPKERIQLLCTELGEDLDSANCKRIREFVKSCPHCEAFVDSVKKTIKLYRTYTPEHSEDVHQRLFKKLNLE